LGAYFVALAGLATFIDTLFLDHRMPPTYMLDIGKQTKQFFDSYVDVYGQKKYRLKTLEQYSREHNTKEQPGKHYFKANTLPEIVNTAPMPTFKSSSRQGHEVEKGEINCFSAFA
jgi:dual specificity protein kinase YAK1